MIRLLLLVTLGCAEPPALDMPLDLGAEAPVDVAPPERSALSPLPPAPACLPPVPLLTPLRLTTPLSESRFTTEALRTIRAAPEQSICLEDELRSQRRAAEIIRIASRWLGAEADVWVYEAPDFDAALAHLCGLVTCGEPVGALDPQLRAVMAPLLWAIADAFVARQARVSDRGSDWWQTHSGTNLIYHPEAEGFDPERREDLDFLLEGRAELYAAAAAIAHQIEGTDWSDLRSGDYELWTGGGYIRVRGTTDDQDDGAPTLLLIDLGGDDRYGGEIASNQSGANAVSLLIDVAGNDDYGIDDDAERYPGDEHFGGISLSRSFRQGAARNGIAMLFDLAGNDRYRSLRGSQGYAHHGVGLLFDGAGDDHYEAEAVSQGAAQFGIGLLIDQAGADRYYGYFGAQGFGFVGGVGMLLDLEGDDDYTCEVDDVLYHSPQLPGVTNSSLCQGAGFGLRSEVAPMSGGIGVLSDRAGDDRYLAGVYAQGVGYWEGVGMLADAAGDDQYDALYYAQGAGVHYAAGLLVDRGGDDLRGTLHPPQNLSLGAGYDWSVGVLFDLGGRDQTVFEGLGVGAASADGVGLYVDLGGEDSYSSPPGRNNRGGRSAMLDDPAE